VVARWIFDEEASCGSAIPILFVCMGNICRSPIAEAVTRTLAQRLDPAALLDFDSAGTHGHFHAGEAPDARARRVALRRGYDVSRHRARSVIDADFARFDRILAMDEANLSALQRVCPEDIPAQARAVSRTTRTGLGITEIPDPYYGAESGFERVVDLCELAARGLLADLARRQGAG
jgi:protein-tyrosine phosphatase